MIASLIAGIIANFMADFLVLGLLVAAFAIARAPRPITRTIAIEKLLAWYVFFNIGVMFLVNFVFHVFFGRMAAAFIGWADSPFQFEVGIASLGVAVGGFLAAFHSFDRRLIAIVVPAIFLLGAAAGHAWQMITAHNFAPGNAGTVFYLDIIIPLFGFALLWLQRHNTHATGQSPRSASPSSIGPPLPLWGREPAPTGSGGRRPKGAG